MCPHIFWKAISPFIINFQKIKRIQVFILFQGDLEGVGTLCPHTQATFKFSFTCPSLVSQFRVGGLILDPLLVQQMIDNGSLPSIVQFFQISIFMDPTVVFFIQIIAMILFSAATAVHSWYNCHYSECSDRQGEENSQWAK